MKGVQFMGVGGEGRKGKVSLTWWLSRDLDQEPS